MQTGSVYFRQMVSIERLETLAKQISGGGNDMRSRMSPIGCGDRVRDLV